jgi:tetratricopeptide (TPR) repeat protein
MYLGTAYLAEGRFDDAAEQFEIVTRSSDHLDLNFGARRYRSSSLLDLGIAYLLLGDYPRALSAFQRLNQFDAPLLQQVIEGYDRSLTTRTSEVGYLKLSMLLQAEGKNREAFILLDDVTKANPDYEGARQLLSYLKSNQN